MNRLPPETLSLIFSYVFAPMSMAAATGFDIPFPFRQWEAVTHVCRYWREAAIASPTIWSKIETSQPNLIQLFLSWSGAHPLEFHTIPLLKPPEDPPSFLALLPHLNRLKTLSVQMSQRAYDLLAEATVSSLEWLWVCAPLKDSTHPTDWAPPLFMGTTQAPRLQHPCLSRGPLMSPFKFGNLSHLCFDRIPSLGSKLPAVLEMLACNPNLQELLLSHKGGTATSTYNRSLNLTSPCTPSGSSV